MRGGGAARSFGSWLCPANVVVSAYQLPRSVPATTTANHELDLATQAASPPLTRANARTLAQWSPTALW